MKSLSSHWSLDPDVVFLNHGSFGACPTAVLEYQRELQQRLERQPMDFMVRELEDLLDDARASLAAFVDCAAEDLVFVPNATTGVNAVLRSLELNADDEVLTTNHAYNACRNALDFVANRAGAHVVVADVPFPIADPAQATHAILDKVTSRTKIALVDHITSSTGLVLPLADILDGLRERGVLSLVDAAHAPGHVPVSLSALEPDFYTGNAHKWLCTPKGSALLYVRRELQPTVRPVVISHGANAERSDRSRFLLEFDWTGTHDPTAYLSVGFAIDYIAGLVEGGWPAIIERNHALALYARGKLLEVLGIEAPAPESMIGNLVTVPLPEARSEPAPGPVPFDALQEELHRDHKIEVPVFPWPCPPGRALRISAQLYNDESHYDTLAAALQTALAQ